MKRREFLKFMGRATTISWAATAASPAFLAGSKSLAATLNTSPANYLKSSLKAQRTDVVLTIPGLSHKVLIKWQDPISKSEKFGFNNDYIAILPGPSLNENYLWVNHESVHPYFVSDYNPDLRPGIRKSKAQVDIEQKDVGGSFLHLKNEKDSWHVVTDSHDAFRIDGKTPLSLISQSPIVGKKMAIGTTANCSGGVTAWGTILTCEENYDDFYGQVRFKKSKGKNNKRQVLASSSIMAWDDHTPYPPEHYGWVVEINPKTKDGKKLTALGRFAHEGALVTQASDGRCVVYMGDDANDEHFYKFIAKTKGSLEQGDLYVANTTTGKWEHLSIENPLLKPHFNSQTELLIRTREAAKIVGATPLDRPESSAQDPLTGNVFLACTNNKMADRPYGSIIKFEEKDRLSLTFKSETFLTGGLDAGLACPDNIIFDSKGNLWVTSDISDNDVGKEGYKDFGNNALYFIPLQAGPNAGRALRVAIAPMDAEFTGPCFSADEKTLFLSVQHPGANTVDPKNPTSHWPEGGTAIPRPAVITLQGPLLEALANESKRPPNS